MPGLLEASDDGMYVVKFRGAGQGLKVLVAEALVGGIGRLLGVRIPDLAVVDVPRAIARYEADEEVQDLLDASPGTGLGLDYLPGAFGYDGSRPPTQEEAARILWLDAFTANVDRTWANPNLLLWHRRVWAIDHGAALYVHHSWPSKGSHPERFAAQRFDASTHVLRDVVGDPQQVAEVHAQAVPTLTAGELDGVLAQIPDDWFEPAPGLPDPDAVRVAYRENLLARAAVTDAWLPTAQRGWAS